jgi:hypothetical protein
MAVAVQAGKVEVGSKAHSTKVPHARRYRDRVPRHRLAATAGLKKSKPPLIRRTESRPGKTFGIASHAFENP